MSEPERDKTNAEAVVRERHAALEREAERLRELAARKEAEAEVGDGPTREP